MAKPKRNTKKTGRLTILGQRNAFRRATRLRYLEARLARDAQEAQRLGVDAGPCPDPDTYAAGDQRSAAHRLHRAQSAVIRAYYHGPQREERLAALTADPLAPLHVTP